MNLRHGTPMGLPCLLGSGLAALCLAVQVQAGDGIGPQGRIGPSGALGPAGGATATPARPPVAAPAKEGRPAAGNHIEASGNRAGAVHCGLGGASVNSVDVQGAQLHGRTVIVQEGNASRVDTRDCPPPAGTAPSTQTNSIRIR